MWWEGSDRLRQGGRNGVCRFDGKSRFEKFCLGHTPEQQVADGTGWLARDTCQLVSASGDAFVN